MNRDRLRKGPVFLFPETDHKEKTVDETLNEIKARKEVTVKPLKPLKMGEKQNLCHNYAVMAMANLDRIQKGDPQGAAALMEAMDYINQGLEKEFKRKKKRC